MTTSTGTLEGMEAIVSSAERQAFAEMSEDINDEKGDVGLAEACIGSSAWSPHTSRRERG